MARWAQPTAAAPAVLAGDRAPCIWVEDFGGPLPGMDTPATKKKAIDEQIVKATAAIAKLGARGVDVLFLRPPSSGAYYAFEQKYLPRAETWDLLLARTGAPGIHFEDYPQLQGYTLPEWSHLSASEADRFTAALVPIIEREYWRKPRRVVDATTPTMADISPATR